MATNDTGTGEEIIEKKATSPVASACLLIACVALVGSIVFQIAEVAAYRTGGRVPLNIRKGVGQDKADNFIKAFRLDVQEILTKSAIESSGDLDLGLAPEPAEEPAMEPADEPLEEPAEEPLEEPAEEPAPE